MRKPFYNNTVILDQHYYNTILIQGTFHLGIKVLAWHIDMHGNKTKNIFECMYPTYMKSKSNPLNSSVGPVVIHVTRVTPNQCWTSIIFLWFHLGIHIGRFHFFGSSKVWYLGMFLFFNINQLLRTMQEPSDTNEIILKSTWFKMISTQISIWVYKDCLTLTYPHNIIQTITMYCGTNNIPRTIFLNIPTYNLNMRNIQ